jgi:hypothetical protein
MSRSRVPGEKRLTFACARDEAEGLWSGSCVMGGAR